MIEIAEQHLFRAMVPVGDAYSTVIRRFFNTEFPTSAAASKEDQLELLTGIIIGTNNVRYGPKPCVESQVAIREVIRESIAAQKAVPILVPWGGRKTVDSRSVDVAEVVGLKQLNCLQSSVRRVYAPGLDINIRVEDTGAHYLYQNEGIDGDRAIEKYCSDFQRLVRVLNLGFINATRESTLMSIADYFRVADEIQGPMFDFLVESTALGFRPQSANYKKLLELGWQGEIPQEQREYYWARYETQEPGLSEFMKNTKLSMYFAGSLARYKLKGVGANPAWGKYIRLLFVPRVPGAPAALSSRDISYRTIPEKISRTHMPAWRSKGYFKIVDDEASPRLASFHEKLDLIECEVALSRSGESVTVKTDYLLAE